MKKIFIISSTIVLVGLCVFLYPLVASILSERAMAKAVTRYSDAVDEYTDDTKNKILERAISYNKNVPRNVGLIHELGYQATIGTDEDYERTLALTKDGVMATLYVPKLGWADALPIYHYCTEKQLQHGVGHIYGTSLPIGGEGHVVLTGHRGLPSAELFTRADELKVGDIFQINCLNQNLTYRIYEIRTVLPYKVEEITVVPGEDLVTLVTCTPYGLNTHRLLITGRRVTNEAEVEEETQQLYIEITPTVIPKKERWRIWVGSGLFISWATFWIILKKKGYLRNERRRQEITEANQSI